LPMNACERTVSELCRRYAWCRELLPFVVSMQGLDEAHGLPHTLRVVCLAHRIARLAGYNDEEKILAAALLHDIGRGAEDLLGQHHAVIGARLVKTLLRGLLGPDSVEDVAYAVLSHSYSARGGKEGCPTGLLARIISDADKLDALGAIGTARAVIYGHIVGRSLVDTLNHYYEKLSKLPSLLCLDASRRLAEKRLRVMRSFFESLEEELNDVYVNPAIAGDFAQEF